MYKKCFRLLMVFIITFAVVFLFAGEKKSNPKVILKTSMGEITLELNPEKAPVSVENFLAYVDSGFYNNTIFHRVIKGFMIQGGGFDKNLNKKETRPPIINEAANGLKNYRGTIAYARTNVINSATAQFFINLVDNHFLNFKDSTSAGFGYAVFGKVIDGMKVVDKIGSVKTGIQKGMKDVPVKPVIVLSASVVKEEEEKEEKEEKE